MVRDRNESDSPMHAPPLDQERLGAPDAQYDAPFSEFYKNFMPSLVRFLLWNRVPLADAAEIGQETMAQLYRLWPTVTDKRAWARKVASRRWVRRIADDHREQLVDSDDLARSTLITSDKIHDYEQHQELLCLLDTLPPRQRQVLAWTYDGYTPAEIAQELQIDPATVRANLLKARRAAARHMRGDQR
jgi:RNA polymerase sigma factor (sigma-70 family)